MSNVLINLIRILILKESAQVIKEAEGCKRDPSCPGISFRRAEAVQC